MGTTLTLLDLAGFVALLLWGVHMVQSGVQRAYGPRLRGALGAALGNRFKAFAAGIGVTALLQSSTATGLMAASFAAGGLVDLIPALAVMLGANVGTTLIVQVLSFDIARAAPVLVLAGVMMFRRGGESRTRDLGRVAIGLGLMLMSLRGLLEVITPYEDVPSLRIVLDIVATDPMVDVLLGALITWAAHSSVAVVLLVMSFVAKGVLPLQAALAFVIGANLGSALNPVLEAPEGADAAGRRVAYGNLINRIVGCVVALPLIAYIGPLLAGSERNLARAVADFHTIFNVALAAAFFPALGPLSRLLRRLFPTRIAATDPGLPAHLDEGAVETPVLALGCAGREALRMADVLESMLRGAHDALTKGDRQRIAETRRMDDVLDSLNEAIKRYLSSLDAEDMTDADHRRASAILSFVTNLEHAGDILDKNVMALASKRQKRGVSPSKDSQAEIGALVERLEANLRTAASVFMTEDVRAARLLVDEKAAFRDIEARATEAHFKRLRDRASVPAETGALDLLRDFKRINAHLVSAAAYPVLQGQGELLATRLRDRSDPAPGEDETSAGRHPG
jgi:phosphate:Na+ symporter